MIGTKAVEIVCTNDERGSLLWQKEGCGGQWLGGKESRFSCSPNECEILYCGSWQRVIIETIVTRVCIALILHITSEAMLLPWEVSGFVVCDQIELGRDSDVPTQGLVVSFKICYILLLRIKSLVWQFKSTHRLMALTSFFLSLACFARFLLNYSVYHCKFQAVVKCIDPIFDHSGRKDLTATRWSPVDSMATIQSVVFSNVDMVLSMDL